MFNILCLCRILPRLKRYFSYDYDSPSYKHILVFLILNRVFFLIKQIIECAFDQSLIQNLYIYLHLFLSFLLPVSFEEVVQRRHSFENVGLSQISIFFPSCN